MFAYSLARYIASVACNLSCVHVVEEVLDAGVVGLLPLLGAAGAKKTFSCSVKNKAINIIILDLSEETFCP